MNISQLMEIITGSGHGSPFCADTFNSGLAAGMGARAGQQLNMMTVAGKDLTGFGSAADMVSAIGSAMADIGTCAPMPDGENQEMLWCRTRSGWLRMNPAVICVLTAPGGNPSSCLVFGFAREGIISQKTASGAVRRFETALEGCGAVFESREIIALSRLVF